MLLERIYDEDLAQASYFIGCQANQTALVVDPRRDVAVYQALAAKHGMTITAVTETHIHADYLSGTRELAAATGATMYVSDMGGSDWRYGPGFDAEANGGNGAVRMRHGHVITIGNISVEAVHTPGHTPEHLSFLVNDGAQSSEPGFFLTGDFVFVGDVGRPDLLDEAAGYIDTRFAGANELFASLRDRFLTLPDFVQVLPAHGSGSACGKALGAVSATTVGYERRFSWWSDYLRNDDREGFVAALLAGQPDAHGYFARMKRQNKVGPTVLGTLPALTERSATEVTAATGHDGVILVDTRPHDLVHQGTAAGSLNIPGPDTAARFGAWAINPETEHRPLVLLADSRPVAEEFRAHLLRVGIDTAVGYVTTLEGFELTPPETVTPQELSATPEATLIDVRNLTEFEAGHIPGATHVSAGKLLWNLDALPTPDSGRIVTYCRSGARNSVIASALRSAGYEVAELKGSYLGRLASRE